MAKVKNAARVEKDVKSRILEAKNNKAFMNAAAKIIETEMKKSLVSGVGVDGKDLPELKASTRDYREYLTGTPTKISRNYGGSSFSNITLSGQLVSSLVAKFIGKGKIEITAEGEHLPYKDQDGDNIGRTVENKIIVDGLEKRGWKILGVTEKAQERVFTRFKKFLRSKRRKGE